MSIQDERLRRQLWSRRCFRQVFVEKTLDAIVGRTKIISEKPIRFALMQQQGAGEFREFGFLDASKRRAANRGEFEVDVLNETPVRRAGLRSRETDGSGEVHATLPAGASPASRRLWHSPAPSQDFVPHCKRALIFQLESDGQSGQQQADNFW